MGERTGGRPPVGVRMASPRNSSAILAASMAIGGGSRGTLAGRHSAGGSGANGESTVDLDAAGESEADRLRKKRQTIFKSKFEVDEKIVSRNKALIALVKVQHPNALPAPATTGPVQRCLTLRDARAPPF